MRERLQTLSEDELRYVAGGINLIGDVGEPTIVEKIKELITHEHRSTQNVWKVYGASTVR